ncbi:12102_t:CDS:1, partial [Racocetra fulgida]
VSDESQNNVLKVQIDEALKDIVKAQIDETLKDPIDKFNKLIELIEKKDQD